MVKQICKKITNHLNVITPHFGTVHVGHGSKGKNYTAPSLALPQNWEGDRLQKFRKNCFKEKFRNYLAGWEVPRYGGFRGLLMGFCTVGWIVNFVLKRETGSNGWLSETNSFRIIGLAKTDASTAYACQPAIQSSTGKSQYLDTRKNTPGNHNHHQTNDTGCFIWRYPYRSQTFV